MNCVAPKYSLLNSIYLKDCEGKSKDDFYYNRFRSGHFSTFAEVCFDITCDYEIVMDLYKIMYRLFFGLFLIIYSKNISKIKPLYYIVGGIIGTIFGTLFLSFIALKKTNNGIYAFIGIIFQYAFGVFAKTFFYDYLWVYILYAVITFTISISIIHYFVRQQDGTIIINSAIIDIINYIGTIIGCLLILFSFPSAFISCIVLLGIVGYMYFPRKKKRYQTQEEYVRIGKETTNRELEKLLKSEKFKKFIGL
jgi:hypothetical protein